MRIGVKGWRLGRGVWISVWGVWGMVWSVWISVWGAWGIVWRLWGPVWGLVRVSVNHTIVMLFFTTSPYFHTCASVRKIPHERSMGLRMSLRYGPFLHIASIWCYPQSNPLKIIFWGVKWLKFAKTWQFIVTAFPNLEEIMACHRAHQPWRSASPCCSAGSDHSVGINTEVYDTGRKGKEKVKVVPSTIIVLSVVK